MKTLGFEARFSQNLAPVGARKATKPLPCLHFTFIQPALINGNVISAPTIKKPSSFNFLASLINGNHPTE
jgi:hypothetical protein